MTEFGASPLVPQRRVSNDENMIPLINIVFLLLIFFMVASRIDAFRPADVALPEMAATGEKAEVQNVSIVVTASGDILIDGQQFSPEEFGIWIDSLDSSLSDATVSVQADKHITAAVLSPILSILREHHIPKITLYVQRDFSESA